LRTVPNEESNNIDPQAIAYISTFIIFLVSFLLTAFLVMTGINRISPGFGLPNLNFEQSIWLIIVIWLLGSWWNRSVALAAGTLKLK
jgi:hypothetical protein